MKTQARQIRLEDYQPPSHLIETVHLDIVLAPSRTRVRARSTFWPNPAAKGPTDSLRLDGELLELESIILDGVALKPRDYEITPTGLVLAKLPKKAAFTLDVVTWVDPESNKALQGIYRSRGVYCSQCEAEGFRRITYFLDRPDVLARYTTRLEADIEACPVLLSNGNPTERGTLDRGRRHYAVWKDPHPKPCYLFALVGGNLSPVASTFTTASGREVDLRVYVEPGKESRAGWAMDSLKRSMAWDEKAFGREYDLDVFNIVAVSDFNMGAMENKGLNIFNDRLILASADTATDGIYEAIESVVAHEYFHNWTGNRITCRDWFQLCLKEGLTVFRDQEFSAEERSRTVQRISDVRQLRAHQFPEDQGPLAHPVRPDRYLEINNFYTSTVYEKGAELVRMIATILGPQGFKAGMDLYFELHDGRAATIDDFIESFEKATGADLSQFRLWYTQAGTPTLTCQMDYDKAARALTVSFEQAQAPTPGQSKKKPLHIPVRLGLIGGNGHDIDLACDGLPVADGVLHVTERKQAFRFENVPSRPVASLLRGFSAPVMLEMTRSPRDLAFLMANDADLFNRWQAANTFATDTIVATVHALAAGKTTRRGAAFVNALGASIADETLEPAYRAELLKLPTVSDIAREIGRDVDPDLVDRARRRLTRLVGRTLGATLGDLYDRHRAKGRFSPDAASAGRRALRNVVLSLLVARGDPADLARLVAHFERADNMTDEAHALYLLAAHKGPERDTALAAFHDRWQHDHLVIDTWFAAQAASPLPDTLDRIERLTQHPLFSLTAPNKVRALIGTLAMSNPVQFNRPDGAGYRFVADQVLAIDRFNPQVAARMLGAFRSWRSLETGRRALARRTLQRVASTDGLSRDVFEIVSKTLEP